MAVAYNTHDSIAEAHKIEQRQSISIRSHQKVHDDDEGGDDGKKKLDEVDELMKKYDDKE